MSSSNQRPANRGFRSVLRCAISHYRQSSCLSAPEPFRRYHHHQLHRRRRCPEGRFGADHCHGWADQHGGPRHEMVRHRQRRGVSSCCAQGGVEWPENARQPASRADQHILRRGGEPWRNQISHSSRTDDQVFQGSIFPRRWVFAEPRGSQAGCARPDSPQNAEVIMPIINGKEMNNEPDQAPRSQHYQLS